MIVIIVTIVKFKTLVIEWNSLFLNANDVTFFQTFKYNWIAWETFATPNDKLYIIIYRTNDKELQAIFPFYINGKGFLKFINDRHTDFCNIIISKEVVAIYNLMNDVWKFVEEDKLIRFLLLDNVVSNSPILAYWKVFQGNAFVFSQTEHSWLNCPKSESIFSEFRHLNAKERKRLVTLDKKSVQCNMKIFNIANEPYPEHVINRIIQLMIDSGLRSSSYLNDTMRLFMRKLYENGLVELPVLYDNGEPISLGFVFVNEQRTYSMRWVILYKSGQFNLWNNVRYIVEKSQIGSSVVDFGRGGYDYKMQNFRPQVENLYRFMASKTKWGNWYVLFKIAASHMRKTLKKYKG